MPEDEEHGATEEEQIAFGRACLPPDDRPRRPGPPISDRRQWIRKLREEIDGPQAGTCPVCMTNTHALVEQFKRKIERLRGALMVIAGQENSMFTDSEGERGISLDAEGKMREIARMALDAER